MSSVSEANTGHRGERGDVFTPAPAPTTARGARLLRLTAVASLVANIGIVVTGGVVRLTSSGMGCPTWPRCTEDSYVSHPELGIHGAIEFGNRLLTFALVAVALLTFVAALRYRDEHGSRRDLRWLAGGLAFGIPAQAIIGGISVWTHLNPFVVALHFLVSMVLIALSVWLIRLVWGTPRQPGSGTAHLVTRIATVGMWAAVWLGTVVTGSGPHSGDQFSVRTGFDPALVSHVHAAAVWITIGATLACVWLLRSRAAVVLLAVEVVQAAIGLSQYHLGLPVVLVGLHLLGAAVSIAAVTNLALSVRR
jgi:heme a synthase